MAAPQTFQRGGLSAYRQIAQMLRGRIVAGRFDADGRLPTEDELAAEFQVSRHTVRAAVAHLVADGLVERFPGRGSFVVRRGPDSSAWRIRSLEDIIDQRFPEDPQLLGTTRLLASDDPEAAAALQLDAREPMLRIAALRTVDKRPYTCSRIFVPEDIGRAIGPELSRQMARQPLIRVIETKCAIVAARAVQAASAAPADAETAAALEISPGSCVLVLMRTYYSAEGRPVEHVRLFGRPELYQHTVEFTRHRP